MQLFFKALMIWLSSFFITSLITVGIRTIVLDLPYDSKFPCLGSFTCLVVPILICTGILGFTFVLAYWFAGKGRFHKLKNSHIYLFLFGGSLLGFLVFAIPLLTVLVIYSGLIIWLPTSFIVSLGIIMLAKKI